MHYLMVFLGGGLGSVLRYAISRWIPYSGIGFPKATLLANLLACILLGGAIAQLSDLDPKIKLFIITGLCGGFSTFSTFSAEVVTLVQNNEVNTAVIYVLMSNILGALCFFGAIKLL